MPIYIFNNITNNCPSFIYRQDGTNELSSIFN